MYYEYHVEKVEFPKLQEVLCILGARGYRLVWVLPPVEGSSAFRLILEIAKTA